MFRWIGSGEIKAVQAYASEFARIYEIPKRFDLLLLWDDIVSDLVGELQSYLTVALDLTSGKWC